MAKLYGEGLPPREIARQLNMSVGLVEYHIGKTAEKLGLAGWAELRAWLRLPEYHRPKPVCLARWVSLGRNVDEKLCTPLTDEEAADLAQVLAGGLKEMFWGRHRQVAERTARHGF